MFAILHSLNDKIASLSIQLDERSMSARRALVEPVSAFKRGIIGLIIGITSYCLLCCLKPKFHYADFATKSETSSRQSRERPREGLYHCSGDPDLCLNFGSFTVIDKTVAMLVGREQRPPLTKVVIGAVSTTH